LCDLYDSLVFANYNNTEHSKVYYILSSWLPEFQSAFTHQLADLANKQIHIC